MDQKIAEMMADRDMTVVTPEELAERRRAVEAGEVPDPRSYERAVEYHQSRRSAPIRMTRGWSLSSLAEQLKDDA